MRKEYLAKIKNLPNYHGAGPPEARGPMQPHRLHWPKAGPDDSHRIRDRVYQGPGRGGLVPSNFWTGGT